MKLTQLLKCKPVDTPNEVINLAKSHDFTIISPKLVPYVKQLLRLIMDNVREQHLKTEGQNMIKSAKVNLDKQQLSDLFIACLTNIDQDVISIVDVSVIQLVQVEMAGKIFNARTNEFLKAKKELDL